MTILTAAPIAIPYPGASELSLQLRLGPCHLRLRATDGPDWVTGSYDDQDSPLPIAVNVSDGVAIIAQRFDPTLAPIVDLPRLDLAIGRSRPFALVIETGASENAFDLGGLPITRFELKAGFGSYDLDFGEPNPVEMESLELGTGAGVLSVRHLANANFTQLHLGGGMTRCTIDFAGELRRDALVRIEAGLASVEINVPASTAMRARSKAFAADISALGAITRHGDEFSTPPAVTGRNPLLSIELSMAFGQVTLRAT